MIRAIKNDQHGNAGQGKLLQVDYTPGEQIRQLRHWMLCEMMLHDGERVRRLRKAVARMMRRAAQ